MQLQNLGICAAVYGDYPVVQAFEKLAKLGFRALDLPTDSVFGLCIFESREALATSVEAAQSKTGLRVQSLSNSRDCQILLGPYGPQTDHICSGSPDEKRAYARKAALETIDLATRLGVLNVRLFFGCPDYANWLTWHGSRTGWHDNIAVFEEYAIPIIQYAREAKVRILIEPHPKQVIYDVASTDLFLEALQGDLDVLGLCVDPANLASVGCDPGDYLRRYLQHTKCLHVKDLERWQRAIPPGGPGWVRYGPQPPIRFRSLGWGEIDWQAILTVLVESGYDGQIQLEHEDILISREIGLVFARERLEEMLRSLELSFRTW